MKYDQSYKQQCKCCKGWHLNIDIEKAIGECRGCGSKVEYNSSREAKKATWLNRYGIDDPTTIVEWFKDRLNSMNSVKHDKLAIKLFDATTEVSFSDSLILLQEIIDEHAPDFIMDKLNE